MAEQGSDSAKTEAFAAELVRQLSGQSTRLARQAGALAQAELLAGAIARAAVVAGGGSRRCGGKTGRPYDRGRDAGPPRSDVSIFWMEGVRQ